MARLPKNIRTGYTVKDASDFVNTRNYCAPFSVRVVSFSHGRDVCGNGTAHYRCQIQDGSGRGIIDVVESGKRREQVGYSGYNEAALYALEKLGFEVDTSKHGSYDCHGTVSYPLLNFPVKGE